MENTKGFTDFLDFIRERSKSLDSELCELEDYAQKNIVPIIKPETARFLELICSIKKPVKILEIGTAIGYSAILMAKILGKKVFIDTIEINKSKVILARENIKKCGLENNINVIYGDGAEVLQFLNGTYELIFLDAAKGQYIEYLPQCSRLLQSEAILITDNIFCQGLLPSKEKIARRKKTMVRKVSEYLDIIMTEEEFKTSLISIGDGVAVSIKRQKNS